MSNRTIASNSIKYQVAIIMLFIISYLFFQPILKYFEYVLDFPRVNFSAIIVILFFLYLITVSKDLLNQYSFDLLFAFWILIFVTGIQIISMPWAIYYGLEGPLSYFKVISKTLFCY